MRRVLSKEILFYSTWAQRAQMEKETITSLSEKTDVQGDPQKVLGNCYYSLTPVENKAEETGSVSDKRCSDLRSQRELLFLSER